MYSVYKLTFRKQDKFYIGCTRDIGKRFQQHLTSWFWIERGLIPESITILFQDDKVDIAAAKELKLIEETWKDNVNSREMMYPIHIDDEDPKLIEVRNDLNFELYRTMEEKAFRELRKRKNSAARVSDID